MIVHSEKYQDPVVQRNNKYIVLVKGHFCFLDHVMLLLIEQHWLLIEQCIDFKIIIVIHIIINLVMPVG